MASQGQPLVSVVIPTLNAGAPLTALLKAIRSQDIAGGVEVIVVDSSSSDGTAEIARSGGAMVLTIPRSRFGHGRTRNQGIQASRGRFVVLTVQDARPTDEHWLARLITPLLDYRRVAGSYGLQVACPSAGLLARARSWGWRQRHSCAVLKSLNATDDFWELSPRERLELIRFDNVTSCVRRSVWEELPFPDRDYAEDMAWAKQVLLHGYQTAFVPESRVWHSHERGWLYALHRAYMDGYARVELVDWPSPGLDLREAVGALRRVLFFAFTRRFDSMVDLKAIRHFVRREKDEYASLEHDQVAAVYVTALHFSQALLDNALHCCVEESLLPGAWAELVRFAVVTVVGENLGANVADELGRGNRIERLPWLAFHKLLYRGV